MPDLDSFKMQRIHDLKLKESLCVAAVVQVLKFDPEKMTVNVQPLSKQLENGKYESQPPILCRWLLRTAADSFSAPGSNPAIRAWWSISITTWTPL